jgi:LAS superfamily LD-carboxypeptidase LdcB
VNQKNLAACADIAENYKNMIAAAKNDGLILTASGARTMEQQIALRKQNCGGSAHYNVYEKPSKECHPPTARPGKSMHQQGLAFDIGINEKTICFPNNSTTCRKSGNKGFLWLEKNAQKYGFYNLPSEGWHWSVNGK